MDYGCGWESGVELERRNVTLEEKGDARKNNRGLRAKMHLARSPRVALLPWNVVAHSRP